MVKVSPAEYTEKWGRRLKGATKDIEAGVRKVTQAPGVEAAKKQEKMKANLIASIDDGTWAKQVSKVSLAEWQEKTITKGIARISKGVDGAQSKMQSFAAEFLPHVDAGQNIVNAMPDLTIDDSEARMITMMRHNAKFKKS